MEHFDMAVTFPMVCRVTKLHALLAITPIAGCHDDLLRLVQQLGLIDDSDTINVTALGTAAIDGEEGECSLESISH